MTGTFRLSKYTIGELHKAPEGPGIYAWYGRLIIGPPDWRANRDPATGKDLGSKRLRLSLREHSERHRPPSMHTEAHLAFRDHWHGVIEAADYGAAADAITSEDSKQLYESGFPAPSFKRTMDTETLRGSLAFALEDMAPVFASPLYIGKSKTLRTRLEKHAQELRRLFDLTKDDPEHLKSLKEKVNNLRPTSLDKEDRKSTSVTFAARAIAAGFFPEMLNVYVIKTAEFTGGDIERGHDLACSLEWLANTWHRPFLGKR
jgi:hypothetical protein